MNIIPISKPFLTIEEAQSAYDTVLSGWVTQGPRVEEFENEFAKITGAKYAVAVSNCTTALHLSLIVAGVGSDDEVICPSLSYIATANSIRYVGAKPVFAEVANDYNLDATDIESRITKNTKAILLVHQMGMPADIDEVKNICERYNLQLIEDAACAIGSSYKDEMIGSHSELVCFSFHPRKVITTGDGGMITTNRLDYYERLKKLRQHGMSVNDRVRHESKKIIFEEYEELGYNYRLTDIQASVGIQQLKKLREIVQERRKIASIYNQAFKNIESIILPKDNINAISNFQSYSIILKRSCPIARNDLMQKLLDCGIATRKGVMLAHTEKAYANSYYENLERSEFLSDNSIILPLYVPMDDNDVAFVIKMFERYVKKLRSKTLK
jgi:dTDP-4-amino-4,6-dideoxygalactose transaminase